MGGHFPLFTPQGPVQFNPKILLYRVATDKPLRLILFDVSILSDVQKITFLITVFVSIINSH
jgi:hypothetical protein